MSEYFLKPKFLGITVKVNQICLIMQQKQIQKMQQVLIYQILLKRLNLLPDVDNKLNIDELRNVPSGLV